MNGYFKLNPKGNDPKFPTLPDGTCDVLHTCDLRDTWKQMEKLHKASKVKAISVSNFSQMKLEILPTAEIKLAVDQVHLCAIAGFLMFTLQAMP